MYKALPPILDSDVPRHRWLVPTPLEWFAGLDQGWAPRVAWVDLAAAWIVGALLGDRQARGMRAVHAAWEDREREPQRPVRPVRPASAPASRPLRPGRPLGARVNPQQAHLLLNFRQVRAKPRTAPRERVAAAWRAKGLGALLQHDRTATLPSVEVCIRACWLVFAAGGFNFSLDKVCLPRQGLSREAPEDRASHLAARRAAYSGRIGRGAGRRGLRSAWTSPPSLRSQMSRSGNLEWAHRARRNPRRLTSASVWPDGSVLIAAFRSRLSHC